MPKTPGSSDLTTTAFSISRQLTGPPFSQTLESAELRRKLMLEMEWQKSQKQPVVPPAPAKPKAKAAAKGRRKGR